MKKSYPLFTATIVYSGLRLEVARAINMLVITLLALALFYSEIGWLTIGVISVLTFFALEYCWRKPLAVFSDIAFNELGLVMLSSQSGRYQGQISDRSLVCDWWCLLHITAPGALPEEQWLTLWRDAVDDHTYRRLSRVVRIKRRVI